MRDDLLDAKAAINWAESQLKILTQRIEVWRTDCYEIRIEKNEAQPGHNPVKLHSVKFPEPIINAEIGVIINSIRSSLDILATTLFNRHISSMGGVREKDIYFPIAADAAQFARLKGYKGAAFVKALPVAERGLIETLKPYHGGDDILCAIHDLDIMRKHKRLVDVHWEPTGFIINSTAWNWGIEFVNIWPGFKDDAIIAYARDWNLTNFNQNQINIAVDIFLDEAFPIVSDPVLTTLSNFLSLADSIINLFDT